MIIQLFFILILNIIFSIQNIQSDECEFLHMCKCTNFPLFTLIDTNYLSKPLSLSNQDLFCTYSNEYFNETKLTTFDQFKYFYYRFRTLTFANYPLIPTKAFRFIYFDSQTVKQTQKINNRNVIVFVNSYQTQYGIFEDLNLLDSQNQLIVSFLNSPSLTYTSGALAKLNCYELKFYNTNPLIPIDFFFNTIFIHHLIIDNPSFTGFISPSNKFTFQLMKLSIKDISVRHLQGKHFPIIFSTVKELILENYNVKNGFRSFNNHELANCFPQLQTFKIYSRSIQHLTKRMFESFKQLEYLILNGITTIENEAFTNLYQLKELNLGNNILHIDPYAFLNMNVNLILLNQSLDFQLNDEKHFCAFAQFSPLTNLKTFIKFPLNLPICSCTLRYLYRHIDKSYLSMTPYCYSNSSLFILAQEEHICNFEERLLQCHVLPNQGITIYGKHYNVSYFYQRQLSKQKQLLKFFYQYRYYLVVLLPILLFIIICLILFIKRRKYKHLIKRSKSSGNNHDDDITMDIVYHRTNGYEDIQTSTIPLSTKV